MFCFFQDDSMIELKDRLQRALNPSERKVSTGVMNGAYSIAPQQQKAGPLQRYPSVGMNRSSTPTKSVVILTCVCTLRGRTTNFRISEIRLSETEGTLRTSVFVYHGRGRRLPKRIRSFRWRRLLSEYRQRRNMPLYKLRDDKLFASLLFLIRLNR